MMMEVGEDPPSGTSGTTNNTSVKEVPVVIVRPATARRSLVPSRFINIYSYTALLSIVQFVYSFYLAYTVAVLTTLERRYGMPSLYTGIFLASFEIGHVTIIIFSFTETNVHIPRRLAMRGFLMSLGTLFIASTHILVPISSDAVRLQANLERMQGNSTLPGVELKCFANGASSASASITFRNCTDEEAANEGAMEPVAGSSGANEAIWAMVILTLAQGVVATASSTYHVIGVLYIDNNVDKDRSSAFFGVVYSMMMLGPAAAFFFSSGVAASIFVHPFDPNPPDVNSTHFVGAWWSGFLLSSALFLLVSPFFLLFPMKLVENPDDSVNKVDAPIKASPPSIRMADDSTSGDSPVASKALLSPESSATDLDVESEPFTLKTLPRNFLILFRNTIFLALVFVACAQIYITAGYFTFYPKYLESQFRQPTWLANLVAGIANPIPCALGTFLGGWLMSKFKLSQSQAVLCTLIIATTVGIGMLFLIGLKCEPDHIVGLDLPLRGHQPAAHDSKCQHRCATCPKIFDPVCGSDNRTYLNPCHAGCRIFDPVKRIYSQCGCIEGLQGNGTIVATAIPEVCQPATFYNRFCKGFVAYNALAFVLAVLIVLPSTPMTIIMMRCVGPRYKSWSIGLTSSFCSFLSFIPAPVIFGAVFDSHCLLWDEKLPSSPALLSAAEPPSISRCYDGLGKADAYKIQPVDLIDSSAPRNCVLYETKSLAVWFHVLTSVFLFISLPANAYVWWKCRDNERSLSPSAREKCAGIRDSNELAAATEIEMSSQRVI